VAILGVLVSHTGLPHVYGADQGVTTFFVISGFLITGLLVAEFADFGQISLAGFYRRRFARLMPAFVVSMLVTTVVLLGLAYGIRDFWVGLVSAATYLSNDVVAFGGIHPGTLSDLYFRHTWSLALEEQFYALWPLVLALLLRRPNGLRWLWALAFVLTALPMLERLILADHGASYWRVKQGSDTRLDALMAGCFLALVIGAPVVEKARRHAVALGWIGAAGLLLVMIRGASVRWDPGGYSAATIASAALVVSVVLRPDSRMSRGLSARVMNYIGRRSYSLYLWNVLLLELFRRDVSASPAHTPWGILWIGATFAASELSFRCVERPLRHRLRGRHREAGRSRLAYAGTSPDA
jgi:peptidoglycan/LPS O-acetylase OafA/YrhL